MFNQYPFNHYPYQGQLLSVVDYTELPAYNPSVITAVAHVEQGLSVPKFVIGGKGGAAQNYFALFKKSGTYGFNLFRTQRVVIGREFNLTEIIFSLTEPIAANMKIVPVLYFDNETRVVQGNVIDSTNYDESQDSITLNPANFDNNVHGTKDFFLELQFWGTDLIGVQLPINMIVETEDVG